MGAAAPRILYFGFRSYPNQLARRVGVPTKILSRLTGGVSELIKIVSELTRRVS
jgi:hypothetical protein